MARAEDQPHAARRRLRSTWRQLATRDGARLRAARVGARRIDLGYEGTGARGQRAAVVGNPVLLRELIRNLVDNALQLHAGRRHGHGARVARPYGQVVRAAGRGHRPGHSARPSASRCSSRSTAARGTEVDGSGLGLAIVREIAGARQRGSVSIEVDDIRVPYVRCRAQSRPRVPLGARPPLSLTASGAGCARSTSACRSPARASPSPCRRS